MDKNIILIGFMGSGKTTLGVELSYRLKMSVEDTDKMIEQREKRSISEIFQVDGENYFRQLETKLLEEIAGRKYARIISAGGGTPVRKENRLLLKKCGIVVYLRIRPETVYDRLKEDKTRPLLACEDPLARIRELMDSRKEAYEECADLIIDVDGLKTEEVRDILLKNLESVQRKVPG